jgi:hypothetical protein
LERRAPRVFLSYSDDSPVHAERVLELAQWLRSQGIDAQLDQFEDSPEEGWPRWIYAQIRDSDFVLVVCTPSYLERCEGEWPRAAGADKAVKFESHLSLQELHDAEGRNRKFIPLLFDEDDVGECVPLPLRGATHYRLPAQREELYRRLSDQPKVRAAPLGVMRTYDDDSLYSSEELPSPSESLKALVAASVEPPPASERRWLSAQQRRLITAGAFGVGLLLSVLVINNVLTAGGEGDGDGPPTCRIQVSDAAGAAIDDISHVSLELPAGEEIEVIVEDGHTLRFACPQVAVNGHLRIQRGEVEAEGPEAGEVFESDVALSPEPGLQHLRLASSAREPEATPPEADTELEDGAETDGGVAGGTESGAGAEADTEEAASAEALGLPAKKKRPPSRINRRGGPWVEPRTNNLALTLEASARRDRLLACYRAALKLQPQLSGEQVYALEVDAAGKVVSVEPEGKALSEELRACVTSELASWQIGGNTSQPNERFGGSARLTLEFGPG